MMGAYSYTVSRFVPNQIRDEAVNIGVIAVDPDTGSTSYRFCDDLWRLKRRCPGADIESLEGIVKSLRIGDMPGGVDDLGRMADEHTYSLQFTEPHGVLAPTLENALQMLYGMYVSEAGARAPKVSRTTTKSQILTELDAEVSRSGVVMEAVIPRPRFAGTVGEFRPDRAFRTKSGAVAVHALSFATHPALALKNAKVLAVDYEDARGNAANLECAAVMDSAPDGGPKREQEMYEQAKGHLADKGCEVVPAGRIPGYIRGIARRLKRSGSGRRPAPQRTD